MSTNALIIFQDNTGICNGICVNFDGYIEGGVGELLYKNWNNVDDIKNLCGLKKCIRSFDDKKSKIEFYDDIDSTIFSKSLKNLSYEQMLNKSCNYSYTYVWMESDPGWKVLKNNMEFKTLKNFFNN